MRLTLIISTLTSGGAERLMSIMANYWAGKGWQITLMTFDDGRELPFYKLHPAVRHVPLAIAAASTNPITAALNNLRRIAVLRRAIRCSQPENVISFMDTANVLSLLASVGCSWPVTVSERIDPAFNPIGRVWTCLRRLLYPGAATLVVQTRAALSFFPPHIQRKGRVIPNPACAPSILGFGDRGVNGKLIVAMGRLTRQKGFDLLLHAFAKITAKHPDWSLVIWGEGEERAGLEKLRDQLQLRERVRFPGRTTEPIREMSQAGVFILSSRYEGFPNVLCEAMACGLPVISFDCPSGPREIIRDEVDGLLVPSGDVGALASAMDRLVSHERDRHRLAARATEVVERFSLERIMGMWEEVLLIATSSHS